MVQSAIRAGAAYVELTVNDSSLLRGLRRAERRLGNFGKSLTLIGTKLLAFSSGVAAPIALGVKTFATFEKSLARIATLLDDPAQQLDRLGSGIERLSRTYGESTDTLADGLFNIISASVPAEDALNVLEVSTKAAAAGFTDTGIAADAITTILNSYGLEASRAADISDLLFQTARFGKTEFAALAPNIGKVASIAANAGLSLDELGATLALLTRNGNSTEEAVVQISGILQGFLKPTDQASAAAARFGLNLNSATISSEGLTGAFSKLRDATPEDLAAIFPNVRALRGVLPAIKAFDQFSGDLENVRNRSGAVDKAFSNISSTLDFIGKQVLQVGQSILVAVGGALQAELKDLARDLIDVLGRVRDFVSENQALVVSIAKIAAGGIILGTVLIGIGGAAAGLAFIFGTVANALVAATTLFTGLLTAIGALLGPIGLVGGAIIALAVYIVRSTEVGQRAIDFLGERFQALKAAAGEAVSGIVAALKRGDISAAAEVLWASLRLIWQTGVNDVVTIWETLKEAGFGIVNDIRDTFTSVWTDIWVSASKIFEIFKNGLVNSWIDIREATEIALAKVRGFFQESFNADAAVKEIERVNAALRQGADDSLAERIRAVEGEGDAERAAQARERAQRDQADSEGRDLALNAAQKALDKARADFADAVKAAAQAPVVESPGGIAETVSTGARRQILDGLDAGVDSRRESVDTAGAFSASAIRALQASDSVADETLDATIEVAKNTKDMLNEFRRAADEGGFVFT